MGLDPAHSAIEKGGDLPGGQVTENEPGLTGCPTQLGGKGVQGRGTRTSIWASGLQQEKREGENSNYYYYYFIYLFFWLPWVLVAAPGLLSCGMQTLSCGMHVGSSSLTRDRTPAPCIGSAKSFFFFF